jgi:hypothetical protein
MFRVIKTHHYLPCRPCYALGLDAWFQRDNLKWIKAYRHKLVGAWMRMISNVSWVPANIIIESFRSFWKFNRNSGFRSLYNSLPEILGRLLNIYLHARLGTDESMGAMASHHSFSWWSWWSDTFWVTLRRLRLHWLSCYLSKCCCGVCSAISVIMSWDHGTGRSCGSMSLSNLLNCLFFAGLPTL